jgi:hypothetical protein
VAFSAPLETTDTASPGCGNDGTLTVKYEGSHDGVNFTKSVLAAAINELDDYSYIRVKVTIATDGTLTTPPCLSALKITYALRDLASINLDGGFFCGRLKTDRKGGPPWSGFAEVALLALAWLVTRLTLVRWPLLR